MFHVKQWGVQERRALTHSLPQRGMVSPTRATREGKRDATAMWK